MDRVSVAALRGHGAIGRPDMTVLEAADAMERVHESRLLIPGSGRLLALLTEDDIIHKVLDEGRRPDLVRVSDIMRRGWQLGDGSVALEEPGPALDYEPLLAGEIPQGKCEECDDLTVDLVERDGLLLCGDCVDAGRATAS